MTDKENNKRRQQKKISVVKTYKRFFDTADGKSVLLDLCKRTGVYGTTFVAGDANESAFREGQRAVVTEIIMKNMKLDLGSLEKIIMEDDNG